MRFTPDYNPWLCAGVLIHTRWTAQPSDLVTRQDTIEHVEPGDYVTVLQTPVGPQVVHIERAAKEVIA